MAVSIKNNLDIRNNIKNDYSFYMNNLDVSLDNVKSDIDSNRDFDLDFYNNIYLAKENIKYMEEFKDKLFSENLENYEVLKNSIKDYENLFWDEINEK